MPQPKDANGAATATSWCGRLKSFDPTKLKSITLAGETSIEEAEAAMDLQVGLKSDLKFATKAQKRQFKDLRQAKAAREHLERLPEPGEAFHCINRGLYALWDLVPAIAELAAPGIIQELHVATLGFSKHNADALFKMLDAGQIAAATLLCSHYFSATSKEIYEHAAAGMRERRQRFLSMRTHAKLLVIAISDGRRLVVEASANLRSCKNIEQFSLFHDAGLYEFHRGWIDGLFESNDSRQNPAPAAAGAKIRKTSDPLVAAPKHAPESQPEAKRRFQRTNGRTKTKTDSAEKAGGQSRKTRAQRK